VISRPSNRAHASIATKETPTMPARLGLLAVVAFVLALAAPAAASNPDLPNCDESEVPGYGVAAGCFDALVTAANPEASFTQASGHPATLATTFGTKFHNDPIYGSPWPNEPVKDVVVEAPAGLIGNPTVLPTCRLVELSDAENCPSESQLGTVRIDEVLCFSPTFCFPFSEATGLFNMVPPPGAPARFGFYASGTIVSLDAHLRSDSDYGISIDGTNVPEAVALIGTKVTLWGVPSDLAHTPERHCVGEPQTTGGCPKTEEEEGRSFYHEPRAFLRLPTSCTGPEHFALQTDSWFNPGAFNPDGSPDLADPNWKRAGFITHRTPAEGEEPVGNSGCDQVPFEPGISVSPSTDQADSPTGLEVDLTMPQDCWDSFATVEEAEAAICSSDLRNAVVTLPKGMSVNPSSADGLGACTTAQIGLIGTGFEAPNPIHFSDEPQHCPDSSKIGTAAIDTPLLDHPLNGSVYLAAQHDNPFGSLLAMYLVIEDPASGTIVKLPGLVEAKADGQLVTTFTDQPQLPFEALHLDLFGGSRAALINPPSCGSHSAEAIFAPWSGGAPVSVGSSFTLTQGPNGQPCPPKPLAFDPKLTAGTQSPLAGAFTPFNLRMTREDATQRLTGLSLTPPPGLLASLKGITYCPEATLAQISGAEGTGAAQIADPSCPASSQVGTVTAGAGAGPNPFFTEAGRVYLAGPYKSAPLSLAVVAPAVAGPFDLGNVVVRNALQIDPETAKITAVSDPIPTIIHGIPLDLRDLRVNLDRPNFTLNPTSCDPMSVNATVAGSEGASADLSDHFQVGECGALAFKPELTLRLKGKTKRTGHPALRATLTMPQRGPNADIAKAAVTLPHSEFLAQAHIRTICTRVQYAAGSGGGEECPKGSVYGHARAFTPLLDQPLEGPVYLRSSNHPLPDLVASLGGQIHIDLVGRIDAPNGGIRNTFEAVPDAPVSKFVLTMQGGSKGLLENSTDLCKGTHRATARFDGQNGKLHDLRPKVKADCGKGKKGRRRH
jgi:hypothetical protein